MERSDNDRRLRVQYPNAIYHMMSRGVHRSDIYLNDDDRLDFFDRCARTVARFRWQIFSVVQMTNHFHLLFRTPFANLCRGAQYLLGPFAQAFNRRHGRSGHVLEARYRCYVVEDETYLWGVSRYNHLNPVPALADHPASWKWSSYPGYCDESLRLPWVCYDHLLAAWRGEFGNADYCRYVEKGLNSKPVMPTLIDGWIIGSEKFAERIRKIVSPESNEPNVLRARVQPPHTLDAVVSAVCAEFNLEPSALAVNSSRHPARQLVALLANQVTTAVMREVADILGLKGRDSVHKKVQLASQNESPDFLQQLAAIEARLGR